SKPGAGNAADPGWKAALSISLLKAGLIPSYPGSPDVDPESPAPRVGTARHRPSGQPHTRPELRARHRPIQPRVEERYLRRTQYGSQHWPARCRMRAATSGRAPGGTRTRGWTPPITLRQKLRIAPSWVSQGADSTASAARSRQPPPRS